ncbi:bile acid-CoA:amino acid N-acyltransferase-like [Stylophora pistillata]|uniref:Bile acid-CoA:amino acid N-acyltransferase n=1 Tax=Stylophora pistillata TaxID=50429 RepID=A0A2B4S5V6_STYPI|nr:bile acid-CoA:amino acid N-acyltransferase-like [Stylophora pistillata]PFX24429.1 Bile acid-CoA:amino acid N-acyltransferase [Stylophora pistillata]
MLTLWPKFSLIDQITKVKVFRLKSLQKITLGARVVGDRGQVFQSHAHFIADKHGQVDVCRDPSVGGSYRGVSAMGLLWSMIPAPGQRKGIRLIKSDVTKPYNFALNCFDGHISPQESSSSKPLSSKTFEKGYMVNGVKRIPVKEGRIRGTLFLPPGDGPFPGVIDLFGGERGLVEYKASLLASHGFATLALAYIGYEDQPLSPSSINLDYFEDAANWLVSHPEVLSHGIGMHSICYGSWIALLMASYQIAAIKAIVAISPLVIAYRHPFQFKGRVSDVIPPNDSRVQSSEKGSIWRFAFSTDLDYMNPTVSKYSAITPVENINCPVMLVSGTDDLNIPAEFAANFIFDRLKENGKEHLCINLLYPQAGHIIEPPYSPLCDSSFNRSSKEFGGDSYAAWGGETGAHAWAQEDSWQKILHFLRKHLQQKTESGDEED